MTCAARLPTTAGGKMKPVKALPAIVLPPIAVRLSVLSAGTPAGAITSTNAGSVFEPAAKPRRVSAPGDMVTHCEPAYCATAAASGDAGSVDVPPVAEPYTSSDGAAPTFTTRTAMFAAGSE